MQQQRQGNGNRRRLAATSRSKGHRAKCNNDDAGVEGTGVFINVRGLILTCAHNLEGYDSISVCAVDGVNFNLMTHKSSKYKRKRTSPYFEEDVFRWEVDGVNFDDAKISSIKY